MMKFVKVQSWKGDTPTVFRLSNILNNRHWINKFKSNQLEQLLNFWQVNPVDTMDLNRSLIRQELNLYADSFSSTLQTSTSIPLSNHYTNHRGSETGIAPRAGTLEASQASTAEPMNLPSSVVTTIKNIQPIDNLSIQSYLEILITLTPSIEFHCGVNTLNLKELVVKASGLFRNILGQSIHNRLSIPQIQVLAIKIMIPEPK